MPAGVPHVRVAWLAGWPQAVLRETAPPSAFDEVMAMRRCLLVLDMDLHGAGGELGLEPINYLGARHEQERDEVVVLSLAANRQVKLSPLELLLGAATAHGHSAPAKYPIAPVPGHGIHAAAEQRMNLAVRHLKTIGYRARGLISDEELVKAVRAETRAHDYDEVILATSRQGGSWLTRSLHLDPSHKLRRQGQRLVIFAPGTGTKPSQ
jgi:hypothetical protein